MKSDRKLRLSCPLVISTLLPLLTLILAQPPLVKAQSCSNATLNGSYGFLAQTFYLAHDRVPVGSAYMGASTGIVTFDGKGNSSGSETGNAAGYSFHRTYTGTYSVNPDCTATATINLPNGETATGTYTIVDEGNELELVNLGDTLVEFARFRKQGQSCTNETLNGSYGYLLQEFYLPHPRVPVGSTYAGASTGIETFDGNGNTSGSETGNASGTVLHFTYSGPYTVNPDCTASATLTLSNGGKATGTFTIVDGGNELELVNLGKSLVEFGTLKKQ